MREIFEVLNGVLSDDKQRYFNVRTAKHIKRVNDNAKFLAGLQEFADDFDGEELKANALGHDSDKFSNELIGPYTELTWIQKDGNPGRDARSPEITKATETHILQSDHHPEYWSDQKIKIDPNDRAAANVVVDASKMPAVNVAEMVCDWQAMADELKKDTAREWYEKINGTRFKFTDSQNDLIDRLLSAFEAKKEGVTESSGLEKFKKKHGIKAKDGLGFSEKEQKWYGWSHRAIYGFGVGSTVKAGDMIEGSFKAGFKAKTLDDAKAMAKAFKKAVD